MKKSFVFGAVTGAAALVVAVPLVVQLSSAQSTDSSAPPSKPVPSQACVQAMAGKDAAFLSNIDAFISAQKSAVQAHEDALTAAAAVADDTQRQTAVKKANDDFRTAMQTAMQARQTAEKAAMDAVKSACGTARGFGGFGFGMMGKEFGDVDGPRGMMRGPGSARGGKHGGWFRNGPANGATSSQTSSAQ